MFLRVIRLNTTNNYNQEWFAYNNRENLNKQIHFQIIYVCYTPSINLILSAFYSADDNYFRHSIPSECLTNDIIFAYASWTKIILSTCVTVGNINRFVRIINTVEYSEFAPVSSGEESHSANASSDNKIFHSHFMFEHVFGFGESSKQLRSKQGNSFSKQNATR